MLAWGEILLLIGTSRWMQGLSNLVTRPESNSMWDLSASTGDRTPYSMHWKFKACFTSLAYIKLWHTKFEAYPVTKCVTEVNKSRQTLENPMAESIVQTESIFPELFPSGLALRRTFKLASLQCFDTDESDDSAPRSIPEGKGRIDSNLTTH
ncbi:hypothetical protein MJT46_017932 [Ovis ammon polii x Ovis aries]|nr:hypothetical protein MJT46_017932 [Ovis ammon polii x Ovis aries]